jgi:hypothetical protein
MCDVVHVFGQSEIPLVERLFAHWRQWHKKPIIAEIFQGCDLKGLRATLGVKMFLQYLVLSTTR